MINEDVKMDNQKRIELVNLYLGYIDENIKDLDTNLNEDEVSDLCFDAFQAKTLTMAFAIRNLTEILIDYIKPGSGGIDNFAEYRELLRNTEVANITYGERDSFGWLTAIAETNIPMYIENIGYEYLVLYLV